MHFNTLAHLHYLSNHHHKHTHTLAMQIIIHLHTQKEMDGFDMEWIPSIVTAFSFARHINEIPSPSVWVKSFTTLRAAI